MKIELIAFTEKGYRLGEALLAAWSRTAPETVLHLQAKTAARPAESDSRPLRDMTAAWFSAAADAPDAILFIGAAGIAVRAIAPFLRGKAVDPAVLVIDEAGQFVISLLSGHLGGANALARQAAELIGAVPVITTATDLEKAFSVDLFAKENGFLLTDLVKAKEVTARVLRGERLRIYTDLPMERLRLRPAREEAELISVQELSKADVVLSYQTALLKAEIREGIGLRLIPKRLQLGLGARRGVLKEEVEAAVSACLQDTGLDARALAAVCSIDLKKEEAGLCAYCAEAGLPFMTYTAEELRTAGGRFSSSAFVQSVTGVSNVCERAAVYAAEQQGRAEVLVHKEIHGNVTTAVAVWC